MFQRLCIFFIALREIFMCKAGLDFSCFVSDATLPLFENCRHSDFGSKLTTQPVFVDFPLLAPPARLLARGGRTCLWVCDPAWVLMPLGSLQTSWPACKKTNET